ncbi:MAG: metal-dependent transcriptional regulator [Candidatus Eremiobacteraeota bacterium]|nr:metal-dependent transcriptional regulator [Candidatus Eremiobacteraeota bacterium]
MGNEQQRGLLAVGVDRSPVRAREDYVKAIYQLGGGGPVRAAQLARYLNVSRASVSKAKRLLESEGLVEVQRLTSAPMRLTLRGRKLAVAMVRRHRILETFLHRSLCVPLERIHAEAERIEHVISDNIALRIAAMLGHPQRDPHGHEIPYGDGVSAVAPLPSLAKVAAGTRARVISLDDRDERAVASLAGDGILPGSSVRVEQNDVAGVRVRVGKRVLTLRPKHAELVRIER